MEQPFSIAQKPTQEIFDYFNCATNRKMSKNRMSANDTKNTCLNLSIFSNFTATI